MIGAEDDKVQEVIDVIKQECGQHQKLTVNMPYISGTTMVNYATMPMTVDVGGATIFVINVDRYEKNLIIRCLNPRTGNHLVRGFFCVFCASRQAVWLSPPAAPPEKVENKTQKDLRYTKKCNIWIKSACISNSVSIYKKTYA